MKAVNKIDKVPDHTMHILVHKLINKMNSKNSKFYAGKKKKAWLREWYDRFEWEGGELEYE